jgi:oxygen-independent coproporphyrinogen-3 oxidase
MEVPYNTTLYQRMKDEGADHAPVADWETKRRWSSEAFAALERHGYAVGSAYTASRNGRFVYRDELWHGADMLGIGVSAFSHLGGLHFQNEHDFEPYLARVEAGELAIRRALVLGAEERLIRELVLQLKLGAVELDYFRDKFGVDLRERFRAALDEHQRDGYLVLEPERIVLTRAGLMRVDTLLSAFFLERHQNARYA